MGKYCSKCGQELEAGAKFCQKCGQTVSNGQNMQQPTVQQQVNVTPQSQMYQYQQNVIQQLSSKVKVAGVMWIIVACIQYILSLVFVVISFSDNILFLIQSIMMLVIAVINTFIAVRYFKYSKEIQMRPIGIIAKYSSVGGCIGLLFYSILFGGLIGLIGAIYALVIRGFVKRNEIQFAQVEQQFMEKGVTVA